MGKNDIIEILNSEYLYKAKDSINEVLDYMNIKLYHKALENGENGMPYLNSIKLVEQTKKNISSNANIDMSIDNLLINLWENMNGRKM